MVALVVVSTFVVLVLGILVAGLLRSHADILRSLHELGVGVGDPSADRPAPSPGPRPAGDPADRPALWARLRPSPASPRRGTPGRWPSTTATSFTLLGFLSSGCAGCAAFWEALQEPERLELPDRTRVVIVTKGPDREVPAEVLSRTTGRVPVVMSTEAWLDYQVPGSPFFVLVDGATGRKVGAGCGRPRGATGRAGPAGRARPGPGRHRRGRGEGGLDGPAREAAADEVLRAAGIHPGDPSLYPRTLEDVFPRRRRPDAAADDRRRVVRA